MKLVFPSLYLPFNAIDDVVNTLQQDTNTQKCVINNPGTNYYIINGYLLNNSESRTVKFNYKILKNHPACMLQKPI